MKGKYTMKELVEMNVALEIFNGKEYVPAKIKKVQFPGVVVNFKNKKGVKQTEVVAALAIPWLRLLKNSNDKPKRKTRK
jgi:hypothetical protein